jgi:hypothetical protein
MGNEFALRGRKLQAPPGSKKDQALPLRESRNLTMSATSKKSIGGTVVLILLGVIALFGGEKWLVGLIPAAMLVWYGTGSALRRSRN